MVGRTNLTERLEELILKEKIRLKKQERFWEKMSGLALLGGSVISAYMTTNIYTENKDYAMLLGGSALVLGACGMRELYKRSR